MLPRTVRPHQHSPREPGPLTCERPDSSPRPLAPSRAGVIPGQESLVVRGLWFRKPDAGTVPCIKPGAHHRTPRGAGGRYGDHGLSEHVFIRG